MISDIERVYGSDLSDSSQLDILNLKSRVSLAEGKTDEAKGYLESIIEVEPMNGDALLTLASLYWQQKDYASKMTCQLLARSAE